MTRQRTVAHAIFGQSAKCYTQAHHQLALHLAVDLVTTIILSNVRAHIGVEKQRIGNLVAVFAKATNANLPVNSQVIINQTHRNRLRGAKLIAVNFLHIEVINALILTRVTAKGKALTNLAKYCLNVFFKIASEYRRLTGGIVYIFAGLVAQIHNLTLLYDNHALAVIDSDNAAITDNVVFGRSVGATSLTGRTLLTLSHQNVGGHAVAVKKLFPLVAEYAAYSAHCCFNQTHNTTSFIYKT